MVQRFFSLAVLVLLATSGFAQAFGRFGYEQSVGVPGLKVDKGGFAAADPIADKVSFSQPSTVWKSISTTGTEQLIQLSGQPGCPSQALFSLLGVGFSLYFDSGIDLKLSTLGAPFLSWEQGSVAENVASPETRWLVLSFQDRQPAIVLGFPDRPTSLTITGKAGDWSIKSASTFKGWVRIGLAEGLDSQLANSAGALGRLAKAAASQAKLWISMPPKLLKTSLASDLHAVTATWQFDHEGAVIPPAADLANLGGYLLKIQSESSRLPGWTEAGPTDVLKGNSLTIRFPVRRVPTGRCLSVGRRTSEPARGSPPQDVPGVVRLALEALVANRDPSLRKSGEDAVAEFISQANYTIEPWTQQQLPFDKAGKGIDVAAAESLLMQAVTSTEQATSESNSLLTSVCWRQDWLTWRVWTPNEELNQRASALAAIAGALCPEPERRLAAAMFQAGISGSRGLNIWRRRKGFIEKEPKMIEPLYGLRKGLFGLEGPSDKDEEFALALLSPLRVFSDGAVDLIKEGTGYMLESSASSTKAGLIVLASAYPIEVSALEGVSNLKVAAALGFTELRYTPKAAGKCEFNVVLPSYGLPPPLAASVPIYSEAAR